MRLSVSTGIDKMLALACELGERDGLRRCMIAGQARFPHLGIEVRDVAGGIAVYAGADGPLSEATAIGVEANVHAADVDEITSFFRAHGVAPRAIVSPVTDSNLAPMLARAGYVPIEYQNTLVARLDQLDGAHDPHIVETSDPRAWGVASARAFNEGVEPTPDMCTVGELLASGGAVALEAREGDAIVATACYAFEEGGLAAFFAAATAPAHRRKGWQRAMIRERVARARERGMVYARVSAVPLSDSERNFRARGFVPLYTRVTWEWRVSS